jgi:hypothetical protein
MGRMNKKDQVYLFEKVRQVMDGGDVGAAFVDAVTDGDGVYP